MSVMTDDFKGSSDRLFVKTSSNLPKISKQRVEKKVQNRGKKKSYVATPNKTDVPIIPHITSHTITPQRYRNHDGTGEDGVDVEEDKIEEVLPPSPKAKKKRRKKKGKKKRNKGDVNGDLNFSVPQINNFSHKEVEEKHETPKQREGEREKKNTSRSRKKRVPQPSGFGNTPPTMKKKKIENYKKGNLLGQGANGNVYIAMDLSDGSFFALKEINFENVPPNLLEDKLKFIQKEINLMKGFKHKNIVRYLGAKNNGQVLHIFLEYVPGGSIQKILTTFGRLSEQVVQNYTKQVLHGLIYLHRHYVVHRDIKCANILACIDGTVRLADFGCSREIGKLKRFKSLIGTPNYMAPEVIMQTGHGKEADIWSVGCTVLEMLTGKPPFFEYTSVAAVMFNIVSTTDPPSYPDFISDNAKEFLNKCFEREATKRPSCDDLLKTEWLKDVEEPASDEEEGEKEEEEEKKKKEVVKGDVSVPRRSESPKRVRKEMGGTDYLSPNAMYRSNYNPVEDPSSIMMKMSKENLHQYRRKQMDYNNPKQGFDSQMKISHYLFKNSEQNKSFNKESMNNRIKSFHLKRFEKSYLKLKDLEKQKIDVSAVKMSENQKKKRHLDVGSVRRKPMNVENRRIESEYSRQDRVTTEFNEKLVLERKMIQNEEFIRAQREYKKKYQNEFPSPTNNKKRGNGSNNPKRMNRTLTPTHRLKKNKGQQPGYSSPGSKNSPREQREGYYSRKSSANGNISKKNSKRSSPVEKKGGNVEKKNRGRSSPVEKRNRGRSSPGSGEKKSKRGSRKSSPVTKDGKGSGKTTPRGRRTPRGTGRTTPRGGRTTPRGNGRTTPRGGRTTPRGNGRTTPRGGRTTPRGGRTTPRGSKVTPKGRVVPKGKNSGKNSGKNTPTGKGRRKYGVKRKNSQKNSNFERGVKSGSKTDLQGMEEEEEEDKREIRTAPEELERGDSVKDLNQDKVIKNSRSKSFNDNGDVNQLDIDGSVVDSINEVLGDEEMNFDILQHTQRRKSNKIKRVSSKSSDRLKQISQRESFHEEAKLSPRILRTYRNGGSHSNSATNSPMNAGGGGSGGFSSGGEGDDVYPYEEEKLEKIGSKVNMRGMVKYTKRGKIIRRSSSKLKKIHKNHLSVLSKGKSKKKKEKKGTPKLPSLIVTKYT